jgi:hypothetical protein
MQVRETAKNKPEVKAGVLVSSLSMAILGLQNGFLRQTIDDRTFASSPEPEACGASYGSAGSI